MMREIAKFTTRNLGITDSASHPSRCMSRWSLPCLSCSHQAVKALGRSTVARAWYGTAAFRFAAAAAAAVNILLLMVGNLVGFVVGVIGIRPLLRQVICAHAVSRQQLKPQYPEDAVFF